MGHRIRKCGLPCTDCTGPDQQANPRSLIIVYVVSLQKYLGIEEYNDKQRRLGSDCAGVQANLGTRCSFMA